jgi:hypothetical protein
MYHFKLFVMKKLKYLPLFLFILITGCEKHDWLEPQPLSFFSPENVFNSKEGFESLLISLRKDLKIDFYEEDNNIRCEFASSDLGSPWSQLDFYKLTPNLSQYYRFLNMFIDAYGTIKNANVLVSRIDNIKWNNESERNAILAEALWHRAYWYYRLVNSYGDVPYIGVEVTGPKLDYQTYTRDAILSKIQKDLEFAAEWLPASAPPEEISKGAANHLLTKVYLANMEFDKAIAAASKVIDGGNYQLMTDRFGSVASDGTRNLIWDLHRPENFNIAQNKETILACVDRYEAPPGAKSTGICTMRDYNPQWFQPQVLDSQGKPGMVAKGEEYDSLGRGNANVRTTWSYQYGLWAYKGQTWQNTTDLRRADINWVDINEIIYNNPASVDYGKPVQVKYLAQQLDTFKHVYALPHYILYAPQQDPGATPRGGNADWYVYRLAGTYLLRAEAYYWKGMFHEAAQDINKVRERAHALPIDDNEVTIDFIFDERGRELFAEEVRHSELVRVSFILAKRGDLGYNLSSISEKNYYYDRIMKYNPTYKDKVTLLGNTASMAPFHMLWPIPESVITANTLATINQNKGYVGYEQNESPVNKIDE